MATNIKKLTDFDSEGSIIDGVFSNPVVQVLLIEYKYNSVEMYIANITASKCKKMHRRIFGYEEPDEKRRN
jgi:hypothetical protein